MSCFQYSPCGPIFGLLQKMDRQMNEWFRKRHVKSFYVSVANPSLRAGAQNLLQVKFLNNFLVFQVTNLIKLQDIFSILINICKCICLKLNIFFQLAGLGKLRPNILIVGFKGNWYMRGRIGLDEINDYFGVIQYVVSEKNAFFFELYH